jgi:hypothetical protein
MLLTAIWICLAFTVVNHMLRLGFKQFISEGTSCLLFVVSTIGCFWVLTIYTPSIAVAVIIADFLMSVILGVMIYGGVKTDNPLSLIYCKLFLKPGDIEKIKKA